MGDFGHKSERGLNPKSLRIHATFLSRSVGEASLNLKPMLAYCYLLALRKESIFHSPFGQTGKYRILLGQNICDMMAGFPHLVRRGLQSLEYRLGCRFFPMRLCAFLRLAKTRLNGLQFLDTAHHQYSGKRFA